MNAVGDTYIASTGSWSNSPTSYSYQWARDNSGGGTYSNVTGAVSNSYTLQAADVGCYVRCVVTAANSAGSASANSNAIGLVTSAAPTNTVAPAVTGTTSVGSTLTSTTGTWTGSPSYAYQWSRDAGGNRVFVAITGAVSSTYVLVTADVGNNVRCVVTATNASGVTSASSNTVGLITGTGAVPVDTALPVITGAAIVGSTLVCSTGSWTNSPTSYGYQWQSDTLGNGVYTDEVGHIYSGYLVQYADLGDNVRCVVTATNATGSASSASVTIGIVAGAVSVLLPAGIVSAESTTGAVWGSQWGSADESPLGAFGQATLTGGRFNLNLTILNAGIASLEAFGVPTRSGGSRAGEGGGAVAGTDANISDGNLYGTNVLEGSLYALTVTDGNKYGLRLSDSLAD